jgi:hypothetical protein
MFPLKKKRRVLGVQSDVYTMVMWRPPHGKLGCFGEASFTFSTNTLNFKVQPP